MPTISIIILFLFLIFFNIIIIIIEFPQLRLFLLHLN